MQPLVRHALHAAAVALSGAALSVLLWSLYAGGICGSTSSQAMNQLTAAWVPLAAAVGVGLALRAKWPAIVGGVAAGALLTFWLWAYVIFGACG